MFDQEPSTQQKELLLAAARAAGFWKYEYQNWPGMEVRYGYAEALWVIPDEPVEGEEHPHGFYWNPLEDNEDALLLLAQANPNGAELKKLADEKMRGAHGIYNKATAYRRAIFEVVCKNESQ